ncbi:polysaccharide deacetylase family protein [Tenuibacillus multivorans]|uniref:Peptidoglycan/xylan/chitin deacetylase, PgdA/CDA1 family n=1 Tax=Tenuibacillus multivorans TaxID=237069 RepID=A0A1H0FBD1_9BACI|nr:polysaccharide deacetylase family protein [Tenuibacillus multivorans]GEL78784.1 polysaccharide deacetylase PdaB family [Tenuibacillus multivorans]SDN91792.1 Peptidoglycan/xylan/chitin deacetylase, PgdA/CDA1 family [Tenuibacillus multivorans]
MFFVYNWTSWKKWMVLALLGIVVYISYHLSSTYVFQPNASAQQTGAITKSLKDEQEIAITVNVAWGDDVIVEILDVLKQKNIKATFFINGEWALRNEEIAKLIIEENHEVGLLGFYNDPYEDRTQNKITEDIEHGEETLKKLEYEPLTLVRPPENKYNKSVVQHINELGYRTIFWSHFASIEPDSDPNQKSEELANSLSNGDIILFKAEDNLTAVPEVISRVIDQKQSEGFNFTTVTELLSPAKIKLNPIE